MKGLATKGLRCWLPSGKTPYVTSIVAVLIVAVHAFNHVTGWVETGQKTLGLQPCIPYTLITYSILHGDTNHLLQNLATLILFGPCVEGSIGWKAYALATIGLVLAGAMAAVTIEHGYWPTGENPVGLSYMIFALIPAGSYFMLLNWKSSQERNARAHWGCAVLTTVLFLVLVYGAFVINAGPALVGHVTAFSGGTIIVLAHALCNSVGNDPTNPATDAL